MEKVPEYFQKYSKWLKLFEKRNVIDALSNYKF